jgi:hypothetical protein
VYQDIAGATNTDSAWGAAVEEEQQMSESSEAERQQLATKLQEWCKTKCTTPKTRCVPGLPLLGFAILHRGWPHSLANAVPLRIVLTGIALPAVPALHRYSSGNCSTGGQAAL